MSETVSNALGELSQSASGFAPYYTAVLRYLLPALTLLILLRCVRSLLREKVDPEIWGFLIIPQVGRIPLNHWENIIGRAKSADVRLQLPTVSRTHAALIRDGEGNWRVYDLQSKSGVTVNGAPVEEKSDVHDGQVLNIGGLDMTFVSMNKADLVRQAQSRRLPGRNVSQGGTLLLLTVVQILLCGQLVLAAGAEASLELPASFLIMTALMWITYGVTRAMKRLAFEVESIAFLLCTVAMAVCATAAPWLLLRQNAFMAAGVALYFVVGMLLRDLNRAKKLGLAAAIGGMALLAVNVLLASTTFGARNWLEIGSFSFQPSEFVKIAYVLAGAATLDKMFTRRNLFTFIAFAAICTGALVIIHDFGTALVFFCTYLIIAYLRSGDFATVFLSLAGTGLAGFVAITARPYIMDRFATWGHVWLVPNDGGYQQARAMSAIASGGLFGQGAGKGWFKDIFAADTDLVFAVVGEELGLIMALLCVAALVILAVYVIRSAATARSSFFIIGAAAAMTVMLVQVILNVLGCLDVLPFTGITFPFLSRGGSSLISCWGLLAFVKAADTRQNASFTVKSPKKPRQLEPEPDLGPADFTVEPIPGEEGDAL